MGIEGLGWGHWLKNGVSNGQKTESDLETRIIRWLIGISFSIVGNPAEGPYSKNCSIGGLHWGALVYGNGHYSLS